LKEIKQLIHDSTEETKLGEPLAAVHNCWKNCVTDSISNRPFSPSFVHQFSSRGITSQFTNDWGTIAESVQYLLDMFPDLSEEKKSEIKNTGNQYTDQIQILFCERKKLNEEIMNRMSESVPEDFDLTPLLSSVELLKRNSVEEGTQFIEGLCNLITVLPLRQQAEFYLKSWSRHQLTKKLKQKLHKVS